MDILTRVRQSAAKRMLFLPHAVRQMVHPTRMIETGEVFDTIHKGNVIEDYPEDSRGHSCLILGKGFNGRPIHVVCAPKDDYLAVITAYLPSDSEWDADHKSRRHP